MPKTDFKPMTPLTYRWFKAMQDIKFDGLDEDGHYPPLSADDLDMSSNPLLAQLQNIENLYTNISTLNSSISPRVSTLETTFSSYGTRLTAAETTNASQATALTAITNSKNAISAAQTSRATAISDLTTRITALENAAGNYTALANRITTLETNITSLQGQYTAITATNNTQASNITSLTNRITTLEGYPTYSNADYLLDKAKITGDATAVFPNSYGENPDTTGVSYWKRSENTVWGNVLGHATKAGRNYNVLRATRYYRNGVSFLKLLISGVRITWRKKDYYGSTESMFSIAFNEFNVPGNYSIVEQITLPYLNIIIPDSDLSTHNDIWCTVAISPGAPTGYSGGGNPNGIGEYYQAAYNTNVYGNYYFECDSPSINFNANGDSCSYFDPVFGLRMTTVAAPTPTQLLQNTIGTFVSGLTGAGLYGCITMHLYVSNTATPSDRLATDLTQWTAATLDDFNIHQGLNNANYPITYPVVGNYTPV